MYIKPPSFSLMAWPSGTLSSSRTFFSYTVKNNNKALKSYSFYFLAISFIHTAVSNG